MVTNEEIRKINCESDRATLVGISIVGAMASLILLTHMYGIIP